LYRSAGCETGIVAVKSNRLPISAVLVLLVASIGAAISIVARMPYEVGGKGDPNTVLQDFISGGGTALSPPLAPMVLMALCILLSPGRRWWGIVGIVGAVLLGLVFLVAGIQEPVLWRALTTWTFGPLAAGVVVVGVLGPLLSLLLVLSGIWELIERWRARPGPARD